ncbi:MAG: hypothetical protein Q8P18_18005 [Pseudomonadota bacterium]|nr:hypothetical protein [Pseudomonadota bacterium]
MSRFAAVVVAAALSGCRAPMPDAGVAVYDALGLPDCAASYTGYDVCTTIRYWDSTVPEGYDEPTWLRTPVRWIGTEVQPAFCSDDAVAAEAWVLAYEPDTDGSHVRSAADARWTDIIRLDAAGLPVERQRILRCDFMAEQSATPPGLQPVQEYARYATVPVVGEDFFPVMREIAKWRQVPLQFQTLLSWGEVETETLHLRTCGVRCGTCEDTTGGRLRAVTGVLERVDWVLDPVSGEVSFTPEAILEVDCYAGY